VFVAILAPLADGPPLPVWALATINNLPPRTIRPMLSKVDSRRLGTYVEVSYGTPVDSLKVLRGLQFRMWTLCRHSITC